MGSGRWWMDRGTGSRTSGGCTVTACAAGAAGTAGRAALGRRGSTPASVRLLPHGCHCLALWPALQGVRAACPGLLDGQLRPAPQARRCGSASPVGRPAYLPVVAAANRHVWPAEGHEGRQRGQAAGIHQVALVVQHVHVDAQVPDLAACKRGRARGRGRLGGTPRSPAPAPARPTSVCGARC